MSFHDANDRADQLQAMTERLVTLIRDEIAAVKNRTLSNNSAGWDEKERLVHSWRLEVSRVKADPTLLAGVGEDRKARLREAAKALEEGLEEHARTLNAVKTVTEGLVRSIAAEIASVRSAPAAYGRSGTVKGGERREASGLAVDAKA
ncbi:MAG: flagellar basal-body protein FlbY [Hyphomonadaceae bacterium]